MNQNVRQTRGSLTSGQMRYRVCVLLAICFALPAATACAQDIDVETTENIAISKTDEGDKESADKNTARSQISSWLEAGPGKLASRKSLSSTVQTVLGIGILSLAPAILLMTTSYVRLAIVLSLLRQAIGGQQAPPPQVTTALAMFLTILIMAPVWKDVKTEAIDPYTRNENAVSLEEAWNRGVVPVKRFMSKQIASANNTDDVFMFYEYLPEEERKKTPETFNDVPIQVMLPAFMISELKVAFLIGFVIYLPFLVLDLVVSSVATSMGMFMLPPSMISLPLKLILFVLVDGWHLIAGTLLQSFATYS
ncbi:flagellar type III secretion system pore protein FliP [Vicingaceae bacterium]|nr:flagellar type III secretion system pore protein FliP [Vicingaceae bacterium]